MSKNERKIVYHIHGHAETMGLVKHINHLLSGSDPSKILEKRIIFISMFQGNVTR